MHILIMHEDAEKHLERINRLDKWSAARIFALLEELDSNEDLLERLAHHGFQKDKPLQFDVSRWEEAWINGYCLHRLKLWDPNDQVLPYRIIYAHLHRPDGDDEYHVLAIPDRSWDYDINCTLSKSIFRTYEDIQ